MTDEIHAQLMLIQVAYQEFMDIAMQANGTPFHMGQAAIRLNEGNMWVQNAILDASVKANDAAKE